MQTDFPIKYKKLDEIKQAVAEKAYREILSNPTQHTSINIFLQFK